jgi:hypothetical protein
MSFFGPPLKPLPPGYPLEPLDARGNRISAGDAVVIPTPLPHWLTHDLPPEDVVQLRRQEGTIMQILEIDPYGYVWFGDGSPWFSLRPGDVVRQMASGN